MTSLSLISKANFEVKSLNLHVSESVHRKGF